MQWIIDDLQSQMDFHKYKIVKGAQTEKIINESKQIVTDLEKAITLLKKGK